MGALRYRLWIFLRSLYWPWIMPWTYNRELRDLQRRGLIRNPTYKQWPVRKRLGMHYHDAACMYRVGKLRFKCGYPLVVRGKIMVR